MSQEDIDRIAGLLNSDIRLNSKPWDRYAYFIYIGEGVIKSSGFRYLDRNWSSGSTNCHRSITEIMKADRLEGGLPAAEMWNAAVVSLEKDAQAAVLHPFYNLDAEAWEMTPSNQADIADRAFRLFGDGGTDRSDDWQPVRPDQTGLAARTAKLLVAQPPDLPEGATEVIVFDDEPNPDSTLRVFTLGLNKLPAVRFDQLAVHAD